MFERVVLVGCVVTVVACFAGWASASELPNEGCVVVTRLVTLPSGEQRIERAWSCEVRV